MPTKKAKKNVKEKKNAVGRPLKFPDLDKLKEDIQAYFDYCNPHIETIDTPVLKTTGTGKGTYVIVPVPVMTKQRPYTLSGLAYFLGCDRTTLLDYKHFAEHDPEELPVNLRTTDPFLLKEFSLTIKEAKRRCEGYVEERLLSGGHPVGAIFNLKNNYAKWEDKTVVENPEEKENRKAIEELRATLSSRVKNVKRKPYG